MNIKELLRDRVMILDGAMGTMIQRYHLTERDFRGELFADLPGIMKGNNDMLVLTQPDIIREIHDEYLAVGADIIETNTFNSTAISLEEYNLQDYVSEINEKAAMLARAVADKYTTLTPNKPRFVAGSIGPTNKTTSLSPDVNNPAYRSISFDQLKNAYLEQMRALLKGGVDVFLIETIFDTLNAKAALYAAQEVMLETNKRVPIMLSVTISDIGGHTLSGQTLEAFLASVMHMDILSVGLNCSFGAKDMKPFLKNLSEIAPYYISAYPNAGLPNRFGEYDETPEMMLSQVKEFMNEQLVNIIGGCCGTTPAHIKLIAETAENALPHKKNDKVKHMLLSGLEALAVTPGNNFINIGERCNVAGSRKFLRLIKEKQYEEALLIARKQVEDGAQIIDVNMDDAMLDAQQEMIIFLNLIASDPDICKVPVMIDSSSFGIIEAGLKCIQGKSIVNSISLKEGEAAFLEYAYKIKNLGAAVVVMAFDEKGQADTFKRKIEICERAYKILVDKVGFNPNDIIFDPNVLAIATGIQEHNNYGVDFIEATKWIKENLPGAKVSGGVSNLSFSFRGNNYIREAMHAVFLYHAISAGMDMGIVNPSTTVAYNDIPNDVLKLVEDVVLNRTPDATDLLTEAAENIKKTSDTPKTEHSKDETRVSQSIEERLTESLRKGDSSNLESDIKEALEKYHNALAIIDGPLMEGMNLVGSLFGAGKMFLPQIVKSARTMKRAVEILQPIIEEQKQDKNGVTTSGKYLLATVKGDVHDIGKNIVSVILSCNNFEVIDMGVMVTAEDIVNTAIKENVDFIGLSGLITPSLEEMCRVATALDKVGLKIPLMIGGATTSELHTAVKIAPNYKGPVFHLKDAAQNPLLASQLLNKETQQDTINKLYSKQEALRQSLKEDKPLLPLAQAIDNRFKLDWDEYKPFKPNCLDVRTISPININEIREYINWTYFFNTWKLSGPFTNIADIHGCDACRATWLAGFAQEDRKKASEAMQLYKEANRMIDRLVQFDITLSARIGFFSAISNSYSINIKTENTVFTVPTLRQQQLKDIQGNYKSLSDYIVSEEEQLSDYIGAFAITVGNDFARLLDKYKEDGDDYKSLLLQSVGDRLVEAASEWLHEQVRKKYWGYSSTEHLSISDMKKGKYQGIRPAIGYPSLPDQSLNFILNDLIGFKEIGISLTEHGAMYPHASVSGFYFANPKSEYFIVGPIDEEQRNLYSKLRCFNAEDAELFLH